uniref:YDG domain-containing protein n=1 Tax=Massilia sp. PWRC2 TaxID=2804626 RepID=UPI003CEA0C66
PKTVALAASKTYDGSTSLGGAVSIDSGIIGQALLYSGAVASDAHVASGGKFIAAITLADGAGGVASNYALPLLTGASAGNAVAINAAPLTAALTNSALSKTYDGSSAAPVFVPTWSFTGLVGGDSTATLNYSSAAYDSIHVNSASHVSVAGLSLAAITGSLGSQAGDYLLTASSAAVAASISTRPLSAALVNSAYSKPYDGSTTVGAFSPAWNIAGLVAGDSASLSYTGAAYDAAHVASASKISVSGVALGAVSGVAGSLASDYALPASSFDVAATISARALTATLSNAGVSKVYDGSTSSSLLPTY